MYYLELVQSIRMITDVCVEIDRGQSVLCIADSMENMDVMTLIAAEYKAKGAEVSTVLIEPRRDRHHEPPKVVSDAMKKVDVVIVMVFGSMIHTRARKEACAAGVKYATIAGMNKEYLSKLNLSRADLMEVRDLTNRISDLLSNATEARLTTEAGTDLRMSLSGRKGVSVLPFAEKGQFCVPPCYAESACAPIEDSAEGTVVVDGTMKGPADFEGLVETPFKISVHQGMIAEISAEKDGRRLENLLNSLAGATRTIAELGVNSNHKIPRKLIGTHIDNAIAGHVHLGLGRNDHIGGKSKTDVHMDLLITNATLSLDDTVMIRNGRMDVPRLLCR